MVGLTVLVISKHELAWLSAGRRGLYCFFHSTTHLAMQHHASALNKQGNGSVWNLNLI